jgi:hypothetical protein
MAGAKGRSGRRTKYEEVHINSLAGMSVRWAEENWKKFSNEEKLKVLLALGPKYVIQKIENSGEVALLAKVTEVDLKERVEVLNKRFGCSN